tara:strand:+ start:1021 stop:1920 length:900 start_codon:yes stop_codon:yes gene_type:complete
MIMEEKTRITVQGFLAFLEFLPTMNVVKEMQQDIDETQDWLKTKDAPATEMRSCKHCSEEYVVATNSVQKYCSTDCRLSFVKENYHKEYKPREFVCETCNEKVTTEPHGNDKRTKYCSAACREKNFANQKIKLPTKRLCNFCGDEFEGTAVYCSKQCQGDQHNLNNKNPVGHVRSTEGVYERSCCYDEVHIPEEVMFILECQEDKPYTTEDPYYILKCLEDLPVARYSDGRPLTSTRAYRRRIANRIEVGYNNYKPPILGSKRAERKVVNLKQYATFEDKMAKLEREQKNYTVWEEDDG